MKYVYKRTYKKYIYKTVSATSLTNNSNSNKRTESWLMQQSINYMDYLDLSLMFLHFHGLISSIQYL